MSPQTPERRQGPDRRRMPRGGRRPDDNQGFAPLVLVADDDKDSGSRCEAILAKLRFAVAPAHNAEEAVRVMQVLRPNIVVAHLKDETKLRRQMESEPAMAGVPILSLNDDTKDPETLVEAIRRVLRMTPHH
jgi:PleD family two-component response regulator